MMPPQTTAALGVQPKQGMDSTVLTTCEYKAQKLKKRVLTGSSGHYTFFINLTYLLYNCNAGRETLLDIAHQFHCRSNKHSANAV